MATESLMEKELMIIEMVFAYWLRTIKSDQSIAYDDLLKVVQLFYVIPEQIDLVVNSHRGHLGSHHPLQLCDGTKYTNYISGACGPSFFDWIVFTQRQGRIFHPTQIMIRNSATEYAIRKIEVSVSEDGEDYHNLAQIDGLEQGKEQKQWVDLRTERRLFTKFMKLSILDNHGNFEFNSFHEFRVFGVLE